MSTTIPFAVTVLISRHSVAKGLAHTDDPGRRRELTSSGAWLCHVFPEKNPVLPSGTRVDECDNQEPEQGPGGGVFQRVTCKFGRKSKDAASPNLWSANGCKFVVAMYSTSGNKK